jgi:hypothetical protein
MSGSALALLTLAAISIIGIVYLKDPLRAWRRYRGERLVVCPETKAPAAVSVDTGHAALTALVEGQPGVRLAACSRWDERGRCDEPCVADVEAAGPSGTVTAIVHEWFLGKSCRSCGRPIGSTVSETLPPALMGPDGISISWRDVPPERLPGLFETHYAVCANCHLADSFRRTHPELVVERR